MAIKKWIAVRLGVLYDSQTTNRKLRGVPARAPNPSGALQLVAWESYLTPSWPEDTKMPPVTVGCSYFLNGKLPKTIVFL
jgi:hypothetical protein